MRKTKLFIATLAMSMLLSRTSLAGTWQAQDNGQWKYQNDDGSFATGWIEDGGKSYYLDANGIMLANTTTPDGYYVGADGAWIAGQEAPKFDFSIAACSIKYFPLITMGIPALRSTMITQIRMQSLLAHI